MLDHFSGGCSGDGQYAERHVLKDFHHDTAQTIHDHRSELIIIFGSDNNLNTLVSHGRHQNSPDVCFSVVVARVFGNLFEGTADLFFRFKFYPHPAGITFMQNVRGHNLEHHLLTDFSRHFDGLIFCLSHQICGNRRAVAGKKFLGLMFQQGNATVAAGGRDNFLALGPGFFSPVQFKRVFGMIAVEKIAILGQHADRIRSDIQGVIYRDIVISQQLQGMGLFGVVQAVQNDGLVAFGNHFSHSMGGIFLHQRQAFGKPDPIATEKPHN